MSFNYSPKIVTDGLVLCLDAANTKSYPGSGTTWSDLSRSGNNGTLVNGPTFNSANGGSIVFDGTNDNCVLGNVLNMGLNSWTLSCWVKLNTGSGTMGIVGKSRHNTSNAGRYVIFIASNLIYSLFQPDANTFTITTSVTPYVDGKFHNIVLTINRNDFMTLYIDSTSVGTPVGISGKTLANLRDSRDYFYVGASGDATGESPDLFLNGNIAQTQIYNRALSASEILQNFNATRARFGV